MWKSRKKSPEGKPPQIIEHLHWIGRNWRHHWPALTVAATLLTAGLLVAKADLIERVWNGRSAGVAKKGWPEYRGCKPSPYGDPPLYVKFSDGSEAYVNTRVLVQMDQNRKADAATRYATPMDAYEAVLTSINAATYRALERVTEEYARKNRSLLAQEVVESTRRMQERTSFLVHEFDFLEFCSPSAPSISQVALPIADGKQPPPSLSAKSEPAPKTEARKGKSDKSSPGSVLVQGSGNIATQNQSGGTNTINNFGASDRQLDAIAREEILRRLPRERTIQITVMMDGEADRFARQIASFLQDNKYVVRGPESAMMWGPTGAPKGVNIDLNQENPGEPIRITVGLKP